jgi:hypothetical protein
MYTNTTWLLPNTYGGHLTSAGGRVFIHFFRHFVIRHFVIRHFVIRHFVIRHFGLQHKNVAPFLWLTACFFKTLESK